MAREPPGTAVPPGQPLLPPFRPLLLAERGGQLRATIAFAAEGSGGGEWYLAIAPGEALGHPGAASHADLSFRFATVDLLCRALTLQSGLVGALLRGHIRVRGDLGLAARFPKLFMPA